MSSLSPGTRVGPYEVLGPLGAGGMGEVVRARDVALHREVALKILPPALAADEESRTRLSREARVLASLNHPHIAQVYGLEQSPAGPAIAMELVTGTTLRDRLRTGVTRSEALRLAQQIALALDAAHEKGVIHRDLKPGNIMVTPDGVAKVLDFGLAKAAAGPAPGEHDTTLAATIEGAIVGTPAYMSPEQARGQAVDRRTDIWAFGCILFELLAGRAPFSGATFSELSAAILERDPDWRALPADTPPHVQRLVRRCLEKDRRERLRDIGDALHELSAPAEAPTGATAVASRPRAGAWGLVFSAGALLGAIAVLLVRQAGSIGLPAASTVRLVLPPAAGTRLGGPVPNVEASVVSVSPDGSTIAFIAAPRGERSRVWIRPLSGDSTRELPGTNGAISLFFSPDGRSIGFFAEGQLKRIDIAGGAPVKICDVPVSVGLSGSWGPDGDVLFATIQGDRVFRVPAAGGSPQDAIIPAPEELPVRFLWPRHLPDGRFVYLELKPGFKGRVMLAEPDGRRVPLIEAVSQAQWIDPDWVVFVREGTLVAQRVDARAARPVGEPVSLIGSVAYSAATGWSNVATSATGTIVAQSQLDQNRIAWFAPTGAEVSAIGTPAAITLLRLSSNGSTVVFNRLQPELGTYDLWTVDLARGLESPLISSPGTDTSGIWADGGRAMVYARGQGAPPNLVVRELASGNDRQLLTSPRMQTPNDVTSDGLQLVYSQRTELGNFDLMLTSIRDATRAAPIFASPASEFDARIAPEGARLSFTSDESGRPQVYVSSFPVAGAKVQVSSAGGGVARWRSDGRELYFISSDGKLMAASIDPAGHPAPPRVLFDAPAWIDYDVARDGRFIAVVSHVVGAEAPLTVIANWRR